MAHHKEDSSQIQLKDPDFIKEVRNVRPIKASNQFLHQAIRKNRIKNTDADSFDFFLRLNFDEIPKNYPSTFLVNGVSRNFFRRMIKKHLSTSACIDLHGLNRFQLEGVLNDFISRHCSSNRLVQIVHGQGLNSSKSLVLKPLVRSFLMRHPLVLGFSDASQSRGGAGNTIVLLRSYPYLRK